MSIDRITEMESILDEALRRMDRAEEEPEALLQYQPQIKRLEEYYASQDWKEDFALDEAGKLPKDLKRGVLSEDGIYNALERNRELMDERLDRQMEFALEIDKEKNVFRQTHLSGKGRNENDAEHAWHMAIMAYLLREYSNEPVDISKVMLMCLIHDIVEIDAGDTYAYDSEGLTTQKAREDAAKERIFSLLPKDQKEELTALFDEFEEYETPEAKFAHAMDNLQPLMLNNSNDGGDWKEHGVCKEQVYGRQAKTAEGSRRLYELTDAILKKNIEKGNIRE